SRFVPLDNQCICKLVASSCSWQPCFSGAATNGPFCYGNLNCWASLVRNFYWSLFRSLLALFLLTINAFASSLRLLVHGNLVFQEWRLNGRFCYLGSTALPSLVRNFYCSLFRSSFSLCFS